MTKRFLYKSLSEADLESGIKQAKAKVKSYEDELRYRRNYRATRCSQNCPNKSIPRGYSVVQDGYGTYGIITFLCETDHTLSDIEWRDGMQVIENLPDNKFRRVPDEELDEFSRKLYGIKGGIEI